VDSDIGHMIPPVVSLGLKILKVMKGPEREKVVPDVMDGALFHLSFLMRTSDMTGIRDNGKRAKELQKGFIEPNEGAIPFCHRGEHIIGDQFPGGPPKKAEGIEETPMKGLLPLRVSELQVNQPAVGLNNGQTVKSSFCVAI
jgi:hypothetical protein